MGIGTSRFGGVEGTGDGAGHIGGVASVSPMTDRDERM
jgi:hypothetical protein